MRRRLSVIALILLVFALALHNLSHQPPPWFDEGWVLSLAHNWVVSGHYGHLLCGVPVPSTILNAGFPVIAPVALSFRVLGSGIWQGRLPSVFLLLVTCSLLYHLAYRLYGHRVGIWTLLFALLFPVHANLSPIIIGRQALGEIAGVCYLLAGYAVLFVGWPKRKYLIPVAALLFSLALQAKPQFLPFFAVSMFVPSLLMMLRQRRMESHFLILSLLLALVFNQLLSWGWSFLLRPNIGNLEVGGDPYAMVRDFSVLSTYVIVLKPAFRLDALRNFFIARAWLPGFVGLMYASVQQVRVLQKGTHWTPKLIQTLMLWLFAFSWFGWFIFLSIGFSRYLFPGLFVGNILAAYAFFKITDGFDFGAVLQTLAQNVVDRRVGGKSMLQFWVIVYLLLVFIATLYSFHNIVNVTQENAYTQVLEFLNTQTAPDAVIETYESELFLFLDRDYHYPPDSIQHILNRRFYLDENLPLVYDPTDCGVDYLVIGWTEFWHLYDPLLDSGDFELVYQDTRYRVYHRATGESSN